MTRRGTFCLVLAATLAGGLSAQTLSVGPPPALFQSIQLAINAAPSGATILVAPGVYTESVDTQQKQLTIVGSGHSGPTATIIDGGATTPVRIAAVPAGYSGGNPAPPAGAVEIRSLRVVGTGTASVHVGDLGIDAGLSVTIDDCEVTGASVGVLNEWAHLDLIGSRVHGNGSGVELYESTADLRDSELSGNSDGLVLWFHPFVTVERCQITNNTNAGVWSFEGFIQLRDSLVWANGVGLYLDAAFSTSASISGSTIYGNPGGGLVDNPLFNNAYTIGVSSSIVYDNGAVQISPLFANAVVESSCIEGGFAGPGNISADPQLVDPALGNLHLQPASPCIDAAGVCVGSDFEGDARPQGLACDMGADEYVTSALSHDLGGGCGAAGQPAPLLRTNRAPIVGSPSFQVILEDALPGAWAFLLWSVNQQQTPLGPCTFHLGLPIEIIGPAPTGPSGGLPLYGAIVNDPALHGFEVTLQFAILDPQGPIVTPTLGASLSNGLHLRFGL